MNAQVSASHGSHPIERLWRKLKDQLLPADVWERFQHLLNTLTTALVQIGEVTYMPLLSSYAE